MKKLILVLAILTAFCGTAFADASDIAVTEPQPELTVWKMDTVRFLIFTRTCEVYYRKGYMDGADFVGTSQGVGVIFQDRTDDPATPEDEELTEFTDLVAAINAGSNIKNTITAATKIKLGIS